MPIKTVRFSSCSNYVKDGEDLTHYSHMYQSQFFDIFLPYFKGRTINHDGSVSDLCIISIQHTDNDLIHKDEKCILVSLENFSVGRTHYKHFNKFGRVNDRVNLYLYNDIPHPDPERNIIPNAYMFVRYYNRIKDQERFKTIQNMTPFSKKKFCLFVSRNLLNHNKKILLMNLQKRGYQVDFLDKYNDKIKNKSCYHSQELLEVFNQYKFVITFENSKTPGYMTEKIFNAFLAGSIPIYDGPPNIDDYINQSCYIPFNQDVLRSMLSIQNDEVMYNKYIQATKTKELDYDAIDNMFKKLDE